MICRKTIFLDIGVGGGLGWVQLNRARTDAILTPHLIRYAPVVFLGKTCRVFDCEDGGTGVPARWVRD